ncbi:unnamed protein product [Tuber melanosporum]|uniref:(Perigord truffle) hypothetical protein n=1 Tax=Tuber melanosporum (strain Mel28) TaxID=656061 RepID=D5GHC9_TUBMM|nr:uncharacterized protein GSTUM_00007757001 [Tuber melanosporum]CAZ83881.1 unnamed protein product [Tuber melanosporum]
MPPKTSTTRLPKSVLEELGLGGDNLKSSSTKSSTSTGGRSARSSRNGKPLGRKEQRRQERIVKESQHQQRRVSRASGPPVSPSPSPPPPAPIIRGKPREPEAKEKNERKGKHPGPVLKSILKKPKPVRAKDEEGEEVWEPKPVLRRAVREKLEQDDMEIEYLENKLKIKGKLPKAFQEDGLDFLFEGLDEIDRDEAVQPRPNERMRERKPGSHKGAHQRKEGEGGGDDSDGEDEELNDEGEDVKGMDEDMSDIEGEDEGDEEEDEFMGIGPDIEDDQEAGDNASPRKSVSATPGAPKYIPPSLRKTQATEPEKLARLRRKCHGLLNRLSEANLTPILSEVEGLYTTNPRGDVTSTLSSLLITIAGDQSALSDTFMILHAGFVAGIYKIMGMDFGAHIVQAVIEDFDGYYRKVNRIDDPASAGKKCTNLISFISELYNFQVVGAVLIFDLLRIFLEEITELNTELLLKVARNCGYQLRQDDPTSLKDLVIMMQPAIAKIGYENLSIRTKFMIETLTNLKNNRLKAAAANSVVVAEATIRMKRLLGALNNGRIRASEPLRISLKDIRNTDAKGKWWLVGASWAGNPASTSTSTASGLPSKAPKKSKKDPEDLDFYSNTDLLQLAREQRMNTDIRQAIFVAIMSAEDYTDAYLRILKLRLKRKQEPEIPRVLIHCCGSEASYNPYYTLVARKLCAQNNLRMAFTFSLWGVFRRMGEGEGGGEADLFGEDGENDEDLDMRKILNLSRMYGTLVAQDALGLDILKILNIAYLQSKTKTFLELMFITVILQTLGQEDGVEESLKRVFIKIKENPGLVRGVLFFLKKHVKGTDVVTDKAEAAVVARGVRFSSQLLGSFIAKETLGG